MLAAHKVTLTESELGWGQRPDGCIYALTREALDKRVKEYMSYNDYNEFSYVSHGPVIVEITQEFADIMNATDDKTYTTAKYKHPGDLS